METGGAGKVSAGSSGFQSGEDGCVAMRLSGTGARVPICRGREEGADEAQRRCPAGPSARVGGIRNPHGGKHPAGHAIIQEEAARRAADGSGISRAPRAKLPVACRTAAVRPLTGGWGGAEAVLPLRRHGRTWRDRLFQADAGAAAPSRGASVPSSCCHHQRARRQSRSMSPPAATLSICRYWRTASWL